MTRILVFAGSTRQGAFSGKTATVAASEIAKQGADVTHISLADYPLPLMNEDLERESGVPEPARKLAALIAAHDGVLIATPEYNASVPPLLKNAIDWVSRVTRDEDGNPLRPWRGKAVALCSSSNGQFAGIRSINHLRAIMVQCQSEVISPQVSVPRAGDAFTEDGAFREASLNAVMVSLCAALIAKAGIAR